MREEKVYSISEAERNGNASGIDWNQFGLEQLPNGLGAKFQDDALVPQIKTDHTDVFIAGTIVIAHFNEFCGYYRGIVKMSKEADELWADG